MTDETKSYDDDFENLDDPDDLAVGQVHEPLARLSRPLRAVERAVVGRYGRIDPVPGHGAGG